MSLSVPGHSGPLRFVHSSRITHLFNTHPLGRLAEVHAPSSALGRQKHIQGEGRREHQGLLRSYFGAAAWTWGELRTGGLCTCRQKEQVLVLQARGGGMGGEAMLTRSRGGKKLLPQAASYHPLARTSLETPAGGSLCPDPIRNALGCKEQNTWLSGLQ